MTIDRRDPDTDQPASVPEAEQPDAGARELPRPSIRTLILSVYLPTVLFHIGHGAIIPILPLVALGLGASVVEAGVIVGLGGVGTMLFDVPAGILVGRIGERRSMNMAATVVALASIGIVLSTTTWMFALMVIVIGCMNAVWHLARLSYVADALPPELMGRAMSALGGMMKLGLFLGAFAGAGVITVMGTDGAFYLCAALAVLAAACLTVFLGVGTDAQGHGGTGHQRVRLRKVLVSNARVFATAGSGVMAIGIMRSARQVVFPLFAAQAGFSPSTVSVVFGIAGAIDMALFYPAGLMLDRLGRRFMAISCLAVMAFGLLLIPLATNVTTLVAVAIVIGLGGGLGSGIVMTLGADLSPKLGRSEFLGAWRLISDVGTAGGPFIVSAVSGVATLGASAVVIGATGLTSAGLLWLCMPETLPGKVSKRGGWLREQGHEATPEVSTEVA